MKIRHKTWLFAATSALALATAGAATAQSIPPTRYNVDAHGVDLVRKQWTPVSGSFSIGGDSGLSYGRVLLGDQWWDAASGGISNFGTEATVTVNGVSEIFDAGPSGWTPREANGSTLVESDFGETMTYQSGGVTYRMETLGFLSSPPGPFTHHITRRTEANGLRTDYTYTIATIIDPDEEFPVEGRTARLQSYQNSAGYQIHYDYAADTLTLSNIGDWQKVTKVTGINLAVDFCARTAFTCTGLTRTWPSVAFSTDTSDPVVLDQVITDQAGVETLYRQRHNGVESVREVFVGSNPTPVAVVAYHDDGVLKTVTDASGTWDYTFFDRTATQLETTVEGPMGEKTFVVSDPSTGLVTSATETTSAGPSPTTRSWSWTYNADYRLDTATGPEGETAEYDYDSRGNVTQVTLSPKTGAGEADIVTSATYPSTCASAVTCNLPTSTTDAAGHVTDYTWDATHGGPLTVTLPAPATGVARPQTRYAYAAQTAQFKNSAGVVVAAPTSVTLPVEVSACVTGSSCDATANEVLTTLSYGVTTGVANNLNVASLSRGSGASPSMAVTAMTYTPDGDLASVDGPLSGTGDTTQYRYDTSRRVVGVVGPDPDGGGAGLNRAQRVTYNDRGQPTLTEAGTTAGYSDPNWAAFSPLLKSSTAYDDLGRPVESRQLSAAGVASGVQQVTYDAAGRVSCSATRMNPATFGSLPSSACTAATTGAFGPDRITQMTYDVVDRPLSVTSGLGTPEALTQSQTWTVGGQIGSLTDGDGNVSVFEYDGFNRPVKLRYPNATGGGTSTTNYEAAQFDAFGRPWKSWNRDGEVTVRSYDNLNRVTGIDAPAGTEDQYLRYDLLGRTLSVSKTGYLPVVCDEQTTCLTWDPLSRLTSENDGSGAMSYGYDAAGRMTGITWPDLFAANYTYDLYGAVTAIDQQPSGGSASQVAAYGWNDLGQPTTVSRASGAGASTTRGYDAWGRLSNIAHDASGTAQDVAFGYSYNPANQIVGRSVSNASYLYGGSTPNTASVFNGLNQATAIGGVGVGYDPNGNATGIEGNSYTFDDANRLVSADAGAGAATFAFDPMSRLSTSTVGGAGVRRRYVGDQLVAEYDAAYPAYPGVMTNRYIPGLGLDDVAVAYDGSGTSTRNWQLSDERGSVIALAGATGAVSTINTYDEYGIPGSGNAGRFQYTGQQWLPEAGAYHYRARTYLPEAGRFLQPDPIGYAAGQNVYAYVKADPVNSIDPLGLDIIDRQECLDRHWVPSGEVDPGSGLEICKPPAWDSYSIFGFGEGWRQWESPWDIAVADSFAGRSAPVSCAASQRLENVANVTQGAEYFQQFKAATIEVSTGHDASAFNRVGTVFAAWNMSAVWATSRENGQTYDVSVVNVGAPLIGSILGGSLGTSAGGPFGGIAGAFAGDRLGGYSADKYEQLRGQYCK